jgi:hypothetical protein
MSEKQLSKHDNSQPPSEEEIEALLSQIKPLPGKRFYQRMEHAPWEKRGLRFGAQTLRRLAIAAFLIFVVVSATFTIPSVQAAARQLLRFFVSSISDQRTVEAPIPLPGSQAKTYYALNLEQAQKVAGYPLKNLYLLPDQMVLSGAHFEPSLKAVSLRYTNGSVDLIFTQHPLGKVKEYSSIGASATVEPVQVRGVQGEFVSGAWRLQSTQMVIQETSLPGTQANLGLYWDANLPQHILRWQENGMAYELICTSSAIGKEELIEIADNIR